MPPMFSSMKFKGSAALPPGPAATAKKPDVIEITPLQKMLQTAGPIKPDGTDKFFGMENFGNTCYCNSIMQALFYSIPFRDHVVKYPPHSPVDTPNGHEPTSKPAVRVLSSSAAAPVKTKGLSAAEAMRRRQAINAAQPVPGTPGTRPEDKPDSPEYKKKHAMLAGPILELTYENATSYGMEESTFTAMKDIFMALITTQVSRTGVLSPQRFLEIFKRDNEMFRTSMHQDAHEFYGLVLNAVITNVEDNAKRIRELTPKLDTGMAASMGNAIANAASALGLSSGSRSPGTGWVHDIFEGVLTSETKCLTCETASQRDETFLDLSIDLEQHSSVTSCLRKFSAEEMLCERNKFHCDNCGGLQEAEKRMKIKKLPKILTLHLKRFKYTEDMTRLQKLFHRVVYPYHLRMFNTTDDAEDPDRLYELYAVVVHIGGNAYHGHYVSIIKTQDRGWLLFDDEMVEPVDKHYVRNFFGDKPGQACAYVLFYQETTFEAVQKEQEAEGLAEVALASQEAGIALGQPQPNGTHPSSTSKRVSIPLTPTTPIDEHDTLPSLDHAMTAPSPLSPHGRPLVPMLTTPLPALDRTRLDSKTKEEKEREKRESKEAEKARKVADKERVKAEEKARKEAEQKRRDYAKTQAEELRATMAASKASAAAEEEKRRKEVEITASKAAVVPTSTTEMNEKKENGLSKGLSLHRNGKTSKSVSGRKGFGGLFKSETNSDMTAVEGDVGPQTPEKNEKPGKDRFSFSLGKKKSHLFSPT